jgi:hypothetical protein
MSGAIAIVLSIAHVLAYNVTRTYYQTSVILHVTLVAVVPMGATAVALVALWSVIWRH